MVNYTLTFKQDVYYITNNELTEINYSIQNIDECTQNFTLVEGIILPNEEKALPFIVDGTYQITLTNEVSDVTIIPPIKYYYNLQMMMIEDIYSTVCTCDCGCKDCIDLSAEPCKRLISTLTRTTMFTRLSSPRYTYGIEMANQALTCLTTPELYCDITTESINGINIFNEKLTKQLIAINYLTFYFVELSMLSSQEDIDYLNAKFRATSIFCCINKLGVDISEVRDLVLVECGLEGTAIEVVIGSSY